MVAGISSSFPTTLIKKSGRGWMDEIWLAPLKWPFKELQCLTLALEAGGGQTADGNSKIIKERKTETLVLSFKLSNLSVSFLRLISLCLLVMLLSNETLVERLNQRLLGISEDVVWGSVGGFIVAVYCLMITARCIFCLFISNETKAVNTSLPVSDGLS